MLPRPKRSGGPSTEAGKLAVSRNAVRSGAYSSTLLLPTEDASEFAELEQQFSRDFQPQDVAESAIVKQLVIVTWKQLRLQHYEHAELLRRLRYPIQEVELLRLKCPQWVMDHKHLLEDPAQYSQQLAKAYEDAANLAHAWKQRKDFSASDLKSLAKHPVLQKWMADNAPKYGLDPDDPSSWHNELVETPTGTRPFLAVASEAFGEECGLILWACENQSILVQLVRDVHEERLLQLMQRPAPQRVHDDLSRAFFRTLGELRKHQQWRRQQSTMVVDPQPKVDQPEA